MTWKKEQELQNGKYIIQETLGGRGFGVTYRAVQQRDGKQVAIKTLDPRRKDEEGFPKLQEKFVQEAFRLAKCSHPHIVEVYDVFQEAELWGMVMEYIDGKDLWFYIEEQGIFSPREALNIIRQVGEALTCVHQQGLLHRDVKPHNIVLRRDTREAVLIDFGLAREYIDSRTITQTNQVTKGFAPLEQFYIICSREPTRATLMGNQNRG